MSFQIFYLQILCFGVLLLAASIGGRIARRLRAGEVVGQVLGGLVVGPVLLFFLEHKMPGYRQAIQSLHFFTFVFLSIIVFGIGDELSSGKIKSVGRDVLIICIVQAAATWVLVSATFLLLGFEPIIALIIGSIGIATAPAATFVIMNKLDITGKMRNMLGGIVVLDDVIEVIVFSIMFQAAYLLHRHSGVSLPDLVYPMAKEFGFAILLGLAIFLVIRITLTRRWLMPKGDRARRGVVLGPEFLSRLITEMPGPSVEVFVVVWGLVSIGVGLALHWHLPFLITAVSAGLFVSNFYGRHVFESLRIENATSMYTLLFFALIGANANIEAFHPENLIFIVVYIASRSIGKIGGTWLGCKMTGQDRRLTHCLPKLMLPQAGVAVVEAFFVAVVLGARGEAILGIILPGLIVFELVGVLVSERALIRWRSWVTGGGDLIGEEEIIRDKMQKERLDIYELIRPECLRVPLEVNSKGEAIWELIRTIQSAGFIQNGGEVLQIILQRERQGGITLGEGTAILHGRIPDLKEPAIAIGVLPRDHSVDFGGTGDIPIDIVYMVLSPLERPELHLQVLAAIARFLSDSDMRTRLRYANNELEAMEIMKEHHEGQA